MMEFLTIKDWLPEGKMAAVCFSIDDVHPSTSKDHYEAGGDLEQGQLGLVKWLMERHPQLKATLFVTADWRQIKPFPTRNILRMIPFIRDRVFLTKVLKKGTMHLERHKRFVDFLNQESRFEVAFHGLYHCNKGLNIPAEFHNKNKEEFRDILLEMIHIFNSSGIDYYGGICPPAWGISEVMVKQLIDNEIKFLAAARDVITEISEGALTNMSGMKGLPLIFPAILEGRLVHIPANFNATTSMDRAIEIIHCSGLVSIKAHIVKSAFGRSAFDGIDALYVNYLDAMFTSLEKEFGDRLWWTSMVEITDRIRKIRIGT